MTAPALVRHRTILLSAIAVFALFVAFNVLWLTIAGDWALALAGAVTLACSVLLFIAVKDYRP